MRIGIFGAGSIGCHAGGLLAATGAKPVLVARPAMIQRLAAGIVVTDYRGGRAAAAPGSFVLAADPAALAETDCVLVCVKSMATEGAAAALRNVLRPGALVASLQNGVANAATLRGMLPEARVLACMVGYNVAQIGPDRFHRGTEGEIAIGDGPGALSLAAEFMRAGIPASVKRDIAAVQWGKLLLNLNNAVNALSGLPLKAQLRDRQWREALAMCMDEALAVMRAAGIRPARVGKAPPSLIPFVLRLPDWLFERAAASMLAIDEEARSSMAEDLERGREPEVDYLNGEIVRLAQAHGRRAPVNSAMVAMVRELFAGRPPGHPSARTVLERLRAA